MTNSDALLCEIMKNTANVLLQPLQMQVNSFSDLKAGLEIPKLVMQLLNEQIAGIQDIEKWKGKAFFKARVDGILQQNFEIVKKHLVSKNNTFKNLQYPNSDKDLLAVMKLLLSRLFIGKTSSEMYTFISKYLKSNQSPVSITNMGKSWANGLPLIALLSIISNEQIRYEDNGDLDLNFEYIKNSCTELNIPLILTKECLSTQINDFYNCLQVTIILKQANIAVDSNQPDDRNQKRFEDKIAEYNNAIKTLNEAIDNKRNELNKYLKCTCFDDFCAKRDLIHQFNQIGNKKLNELYAKVKEAHDTINRLSPIYKIPVPTDLIDIKQIEEKLDSLRKLCSTQQQSLELEENLVRQIDEQVSRIYNLDDARETYETYKNEYDFANWKKYEMKSFVYRLGEKIKMYEERMENSTFEYNQLLNSFNSTIDKVKETTQSDPKTHEDMKQLTKDVDNISYLVYDLQRKHRSLKAIQPSTTIELPDLNSQIRNARKMIDESHLSICKHEAKMELEKITNEYEKLQAEVPKLDEYENYYSVNLVQTALKVHPLNIPNHFQMYNILFELRLNKIESDSELTQIDSEAQSIIHQATKMAEEAKQKLSQKEELSIHIKYTAYDALEACKRFKSCELNECAMNKQKADNLIKEAESLKKWNEQANGDAIDAYNKSLKEAYEIIENADSIIETKFNKDFERIKDKLKSIQEKIDVKTDDLDGDLRTYKSLLDSVSENMKATQIISAINDEMKLQKDAELDTIFKEFQPMEASIKQLIDEFPQRVSNQINELKDQIFQIINEKSKYDEQLAQDNSRSDELSYEEINSKTNEIESKIITINQIVSQITHYKTEYGCTNETPDCREIKQYFFDLITMYKSTLLLKPATGVDKIIEKMSKKEDIYSALEYSILYLNKFTTENCAKLEENTIDPKGKLDKFIDIANDHVSTQISTILNLKDINESNKITLNILIEYIKYVKQAKDALIQYFSEPISIKEIDKLNEGISQIETYISTITYLTNLLDADILVNVFNEIYSKFVHILDDLEVSSKNFPTLSNSKLTPEKDWKDAKVKILDMSSYPWKIGFADQESPSFVDSINGLTIEDKLLNLFGSKPVYDPIVVTGSKIRNSNYKDASRILFEKLKCPAVYGCDSAVLAVISTGRTTGISIDVSDDNVRIIPVYEGYTIPHLETIVEIGKIDVIKYLAETLRLYEYQIYSNALSSGIKKSLNKLIEEYCFVSTSRDHNPDKYELYEGCVFYITSECLNCSNVYFQPDLANIKCESIQQALYDTIKRCDDSIIRDMFANIVLSGDSSMYKGFPQRLYEEMKELTSSYVDVIANPNRQYASWVGGSKMAQLDSFPQFCFTRDNYENGEKLFAKIL